MVCTYVSSLETKYGKLDIEEIVVGLKEWDKYGLSDMPAVRMGSRLLTRDEFCSKESFERILLEESGVPELSTLRD